MIQDSNKFDLSLVSRDELVRELERRHDLCVFTGVQTLSEVGSGIIYLRVKGDVFSLKGLIYRTDLAIGNSLAQTLFTPVDEP